ncbi:hypothetical protein BCR34DRAFT_494993 [Clohesyomyces aquaticus]|uniref:DUF1772-domain-containing protein n=1 Tax=Clohesyomyces aquaticus TaxID=1231657 RepID=A0A1Y1YQE8_9PLEO|nr:hypothetical protein BCR34DRAFT_494993 [Clohesyomyces aquaticus]
MTKNNGSAPLGIPVAAIITGSFLSGAMLSISLITVPLLLDTNTSSAHMVVQWVRLYHYGHILLPSLSVTTCLFYIYTARSKQNSSSIAHQLFWNRYTRAGLVTVLMIPFTLMVMVPTNNTLFRLNEQMKASGGGGDGIANLESVQDLVRVWTKMHIGRSLFPLLGAVLGIRALLEEGRA